MQYALKSCELRDLCMVWRCTTTFLFVVWFFCRLAVASDTTTLQNL